MTKRLLILSFLALGACSTMDGGGARPAVEYIRRDGSPAPFSAAVRVGDIVFLSGSVGARPDGSMPDTFEGQVRQTMENIRTNLTLAGLTFDDVVKCTVMLENISDWPAFNTIYVTYFNRERLPARSAMGVDGLALNSLVEVECIAHMPPGRARR